MPSLDHFLPEQKRSYAALKNLPIKNGLGGGSEESSESDEESNSVDLSHPRPVDTELFEPPKSKNKKPR